MTFTYSSTSIATDLAKVRLEIEDTDSTDALFTDEEINWFLADEGSVLAAAARASEVAARKFARDFDWTADGDSVSRAGRAQHYATLAITLRSRAAGGITSRSTVNRDGWQPLGAERSHTDRSEFGVAYPDRE